MLAIHHLLQSPKVENALWNATLNLLTFDGKNSFKFFEIDQTVNVLRKIVDKAFFHLSNNKLTNSVNAINQPNTFLELLPHQTPT